MNDDAINYSLIHMVQHILLNHCERRGDRGTNWDYACDIETHATIKKMIAHEMPINRYAEQYKHPDSYIKNFCDSNLSAEEIYETINLVVESIDDHSKWDIDKMHRPQISILTWDGDVNQLLDEGHESMTLDFQNIDQVLDFVEKVCEAINLNGTTLRLNSILKFCTADIVNVEMSVFIIRKLVCVQNARTKMLSLPLWIDWSQKFKQYIM